MLSTSCHCGAVTVSVPRRPRKLTQCNCSICRRYGSLWAYYRRGSVDVNCKPSDLSTYIWGNGSLEFYRCRHCGCITHHERSLKKEDGSDTCAVNMRNIDDPSVVADLPVKMLDGASTWKVLYEGVEANVFRTSLTTT